VSGQGLASQGEENTNQGNTAPASASDSSGSSRSAWLYAIGIAIVVMSTGTAIWLRRKSARAAASSANAGKSKKKPKASPPQTPETNDGDMLEVLKNELFQLETDRLDGKISQEEYESTKAGLDTLFRRQIKKDGKAK